MEEGRERKSMDIYPWSLVTIARSKWYSPSGSIASSAAQAWATRASASRFTCELVCACVSWNAASMAAVYALRPSFASFVITTGDPSLAAGDDTAAAAAATDDDADDDDMCTRFSSRMMKVPSGDMAGE